MSTTLVNQRQKTKTGSGELATTNRARRTSQQDRPLTNSRNPDRTPSQKPSRPKQVSKPAARNERMRRHAYIDASSLDKFLVFSGFAVAIFLIGTFGTDLILSWPFHHASILFDIGSVLCGLGLCYLSWSSLRDFH